MSTSAKMIDKTTVEVTRGDVVEPHNAFGLLLAMKNYCAGEVALCGDYDEYADIVKLELLKDWIDLLFGEYEVTLKRHESQALPVARLTQ